MKIRLAPFAVLLGTAALQFAASAQSLPATGSADPANPGASVPPLDYRSALGRDRPARNEAIRPWKETNDTVEKIGGWQVYLKEGRQPDKPAGQLPKPGGGHHGHVPK